MMTMNKKLAGVLGIAVLSAVALSGCASEDSTLISEFNSSIDYSKAGKVIAENNATTDGFDQQTHIIAIEGDDAYAYLVKTLTDQKYECTTPEDTYVPKEGEESGFLPMTTCIKDDLVVTISEAVAGQAVIGVKDITRFKNDGASVTVTDTTPAP